MTSETGRRPGVPTGARHGVGPVGAFVERPVLVASMLLMAAVPLVPRPTSGGALALVAPVVGAVFAYLAVVEVLATGRRGGPRLPGALAATASLATAAYAVRVLWLGETEEIQFVISRVLLVFVVCSVTVLAAGHGDEELLRAFAYGVLVLGALVALVGVTGIHLLEAPSPARTLGIRLPWFKTAGVPRSYGEQGVIVSLALAYLLVYGRRLPPVLRVGLPAACVVIVAMGQSRNVLLAAVTVVLAWFLVIRPGHWLLARITLLACGVATLVVEQLLPLIADTSLGAALIGQGIFQRNVEARFGLVGGAVHLVRDQPLRALVGWQHQDWRQFNLTDYDVGVHNHIASSVLFLGVIAGTATLLVVFVLPLHRLLVVLGSTPVPEVRRRAQVLVTAATGILVSLNFYEGFFSLTVGIFVGLTWAFLVGVGDRGRPGTPTRAATRVLGRTAP